MNYQVIIANASAEIPIDRANRVQLLTSLLYRIWERDALRKH